jgi:hypothetical protein
MRRVRHAGAEIGGEKRIPAARGKKYTFVEFVVGYWSGWGFSTKATVMEGGGLISIPCAGKKLQRQSDRSFGVSLAAMLGFRFVSRLVYN